MKHHGKKAKKNKLKNQKYSQKDDSHLHVLSNKLKKKSMKHMSQHMMDVLEHNISGSGMDAEVWCQWTVLNATRLDPVWLFTRLKEIIRFMFVPVNMRRIGPNIVFFMYMTKRTIEEARIDLRSLLDPVEGKQIVVNLREVPKVGALDLTEDTVKDRLRECLTQRFQQVTQPSPADGSPLVTHSCLNLSALHEDAFLLKNQIVASLTENAVAGFIVDTLCKNLNELHDLNLSDNRLTGLGAFKNLFLKFTMLLRLDLSQNEVRQLEREIVQPLAANLQEVVLLNTPYHQRSQRELSTKEYHTSLVKTFPNLRLLNNQLLARDENGGMNFGVKEAPSSQLAFFVQPELKDGVMKFIHDYLTLMDSDRKSLLSYYTDASVLTFHCVHNDLMGNASKNKPLRLSQNLLNQSRNLLRCKDVAHRRDTIKRGPLQIVAFLESFPKSQHVMLNDQATFQVDVPLFTSSYMQLHFQGVYRETEDADAPLRQFCRTMFIVQPHNILSDDWFVTTATVTVRKLFTNPTPVSATTNNGVPMSASTSTGVVGMVGVPHEELITRLCAMSRMNRPFSEKCLIESQWDLDRAFATFQTLHANKAIPDIAFQ